MVTAVLSTHNGAATLPQTLDAFCQLESPQGGWQLVVVDNGSTDNTNQIVHSFQTRLPLKLVHEPALGKSVALNTGLLNAGGDLVVFTDDDVLPRPDWLTQMRACADSQPAFALFGGRIVPNWEVPPEAWILTIDQSVLAITDPNWEEGPIAATRLFGPNMAVRSDVLKAGFRFDTSLGPVGSRYRMGEDTDFVQRIGHAGFKAWHCKRAVVAHMIQERQMQKKWVLGRALPSGRGSYRRENREVPTSPTLLLGLPRYMIREILTQAFVLGCTTFSRDEARIFRARWELSYLIGRALEARFIHQVKAPNC